MCVVCSKYKNEVANGWWNKLGPCIYIKLEKMQQYKFQRKANKMKRILQKWIKTGSSQLGGKIFTGKHDSTERKK